MTNPDKLFGRLGNRLFQMAYIYAQHRDGLIPDIYIQTPEYFEKYSDEIRQIWGEDIGHIPRVAIHVRRGGNPSNPQEPNYSQNPFYTNLCETDYYEQATAMFPYDSFVVFSDDPDWCKEKWGNNERFKVLDKGEIIEDFNLMASCKDHIIANSSFSYWAALLSPNHGKVVAPCEELWFRDTIIRTKLPKSWIRIKNSK